MESETSPLLHTPDSLSTTTIVTTQRGVQSWETNKPVSNHLCFAGRQRPVQSFPKERDKNETPSDELSNEAEGSLIDTRMFKVIRERNTIALRPVLGHPAACLPQSTSLVCLQFQASKEQSSCCCVRSHQLACNSSHLICSG